MDVVRKLIRYGMVSVVSVTVAQSILALLVATDATSPVRANIAATAVATVPSFELNRRWVWAARGRPSLTREVVPFAVITAAGLALSTLAVAVVSHTVDAGSTAFRTVSIQAASLSAFGVVWLLQFVLLDRVLFHRPTGRPVDSTSPVDARQGERCDAVSPVGGG